MDPKFHTPRRTVPQVVTNIECHYTVTELTFGIRYRPAMELGYAAGVHRGTGPRTTGQPTLDGRNRTQAHLSRQEVRLHRRPPRIVRSAALHPLAAGDVIMVHTLDRHRTDRGRVPNPVSYTHLRAHETDSYLVCRLLL